YTMASGTVYPASSSRSACRPTCTRSAGQGSEWFRGGASASPGSSGGGAMTWYFGRPFLYSTGTAELPLISARSRVAVRFSLALLSARLRTILGSSPLLLAGER